MIHAPADLVLPVVMAVAAGLIGAFALMRRMALASDALSHVALPGIGVAVALHVNPILGGLVALLFGVLLVWAIESNTRLPAEAIIGVIFSAALAVGSLLASGEELLEALLGAPGSPGTAETLLGLAAAALVIGFALRSSDRLVITLVSPDLATTAGVNVKRVNLLFLLAFALSVALGLRYLGVLLMGSLIIIPAATAKHLARNLREMQAISVAAAVAATLTGSLVAPSLHVASGPAIIVIAAAGFFVSLPFRRNA